MLIIHKAGFLLAGRSRPCCFLSEWFLTMALVQPPVCEFGKPAPDFNLPGTDGRLWSLQDCLGKNGLLVMFICNHCPYVIAIRERIIRDSLALQAHGIASVAIMPNDTHLYPADNFEAMCRVARDYNYPFPYLLDETTSGCQGVWRSVVRRIFLATIRRCNCNTVAVWMPVGVNPPRLIQ